MSTLFVNNLNTASGSTITVPTGKQIIGTDTNSIKAPGMVIQSVHSDTSTWTPRATTTSGMTNAKAPGRLTSGRGIHGVERSVMPNQNLSGTSNTSLSDKPPSIAGRASEKVRQRTPNSNIF